MQAGSAARVCQSPVSECVRVKENCGYDRRTVPQTYPGLGGQRRCDLALSVPTAIACSIFSFYPWV